MKRIDNPPNPFVSQHCDWLEPPPKAEVEVYADDSRSILSENDSPDLGFRWSVNPYRGCQHACAYCYARPTHEYLGLGAGTDFDSKLIVKPNAPELLAERFSKRGWKREVVVFSGVTDCYQPLEAVWQLTRRCLEVCANFRNPVGIVTKSYLVVRDIDVLLKLKKCARVKVHCSIPFENDAVARKIEAGAPSPSRRFEAMRKLSEAGIPVGIMIAPVIPGLSDREIPALLERAKECGALSAAYAMLRLPGSVREVFLSRIQEAMPDAAKRVESLIRQARGGKLNDSRFGSRFRGDGAYWDGVQQLFKTSARRFGFDVDGGMKRRGAGKNENAAEKAVADVGDDETRQPDTAKPVQLSLFGRELPQK